MKTHDDQLCQLLTEFETWQDGDELNEQRLVEHDLVLAHLARLYGGLSWHSQQFGLLPSSSLTVEIEEQKPVTLSHLLAVTATGKLLVCASVPIPEYDNPIENKGLFAITRPLKLPEALQKKWPDFPLYQVKLAWRAWEAGIDEIVKTGEGIPIGRLKGGQWDADYIPPVMSLGADKRLWQQATEIMNQVSSVASGDSRVAEQVLTLQQTDLSHLSPLAFWQAHCRCLVALKDHPKLADDADYRAKLASLVSSCESGLWEKEESLLPLGLIWKEIEKRLAKESERQKGMVQLMKKVNQLASRDSQVADFVLALQQTDLNHLSPLAFWQAHCRCLVGLKDHPKLADDADYQDSVSKLLSETFSPLAIGDGLEPLRLAWQRVEQGLDKKEKPVPKPERYVSLAWYATSMVGMVLFFVLLGLGLVYQHDQSSNEMKAAFEKQLAALEKKQAERAEKLSEELIEVDKHLKTDLTAQIENVATTHSEKLATQSDQFNTAITGLANVYNDGLIKLQTQSSKQIASLESKQAQTAKALKTEIRALENEYDKKTGKLSEQLSEVDKRIGKDLTAQIENVAKTHSKELAAQSNQFKTAITGLANVYNDGLIKLQTQSSQGDSANAKQIATLESKQAQNAQGMTAQSLQLAKLKSDIQSALKKHSEDLATQSDQLIKLKKRERGLAGEVVELNAKQTQNTEAMKNQLVNLKTDLTAQIEKVATTHSKELGVQSRQFKTAIGGVANEIATLESKQAEMAQALKIEIRALDNEYDKKTGKLSEQLSEVDKRIGKVFRDRLKDGTLGPEMIVIPAGTFRMGDIQGGGYSEEKPVHEVSIKSFAMGRYEITFAEYDKFAEATARKKPDDRGWGRGNRPVINVSWEEVTAYAEWLSTQTGQQYRLPTEAEWEYAARAGTETKYWWGNTASHEYANYGTDKCCDGLAKGKDRWKYTSPVGSFAANPFGLYDMAGNVWEWTCSEYESTYKGKEKYCLSKENSTKDSLFVLRGGDWLDYAMSLRSASRSSRNRRTYRSGIFGARLARIL